MGKINRVLRRAVNIKNRAQLKNKEFSLISNDCLGGMILHDLGIQFRSPTVNLYILQQDYLRFLSDLPRYLSAELVFSDEDEREKGFPVAVLCGDVKVFFMHYASRDIARGEWEKRAARVDLSDPDNIFVLFSALKGCTYETLESFDKLPFTHKAALTRLPYPELASAYRIEGFELEKRGLAPYFFVHRFSGKKHYDKFPYVRWLNGKQIKNAPEAARSTPRTGAIHIGKPYLEKAAEGVRLCAKTEHYSDNKKTHSITWFEVREEYARYLTDDRADAFVAGFITTAMREGRDIVCDAPISAELLTRLNSGLIPTVSRNIPEYHDIRVFAERTTEKIISENAVGTGWTGGVDSLYTVMNTPDLTHLLITSNGALEDDGEHKPRELLRIMEERAKSGIAADTGLKVIAVDTDLQELQTEIFITNFAFRHAAVVLALQKLFGEFRWSCGTSSLDRSFTIHNCGHYDSFVYECMSTRATTISACGSGVSRAEKLRALSEYAPAHKYLHPCIHAADKNCCVCAKCVRTMTALDTLDTLERFSGVFDTEKFCAERDGYISRLMLEAYNGDAREVIDRYRARGYDPDRLKASAQSLLPPGFQVIVGKRGVYSRVAPGRENTTAFFIPRGWHRVTETARDSKGRKWGRLLTGYGWIELSKVTVMPEQNPIYKKCAALYHKILKR